MTGQKKPWRRKAKKFYRLEDSQFYKLQSKKKLATLLFTSVTALEGMADKSVQHYEYWEEEKADGSMRPLCRPHEGLDKVQSRISYLLACIKTPDYVHAPVPGKTYVTNAAVHRGSRSFALLDIENFYPSCREEKVVSFFKNKMMCSLDVAVILARLCCDKGSLPQGASTSPILSYWTYSQMWDSICAICSKAGNKFTLYLDDLSISGDQVLGQTLWQVRKQVRKHGLKIKESKTRRLLNKPADITGAIVSGEELRLPNCQHQKLSLSQSQFSKPGGDRVRKANVLRGRRAQAKQVIGH